MNKEIQDKIADFDKLDAQYKQAWVDFEHAHVEEIRELEALREERNAKLDELRREIRKEAERISESRITIKIGSFTLQKKWSDFYSSDRLVSKLKDVGLYDTALQAGIVKQSIEIAKFDEVNNFLRSYGFDKEFEDCEDGEEVGSTITGPKPIPALGVELKKE